MNSVIPLKCNCGGFRGTATFDLKQSLGRVVCLCDDCQAYAHYLGRAKEVLDINGGTDVFPVAPSGIKITQGSDSLKCLRLTDRGMFRWYTGCCKTPIANSMPIVRMPFAGVVHTIMDHADLGPIRARVQGRFGIGPLPKGTYQRAPLSLILSSIRFLTRGWLKKQYQPSPFFDSKTGKPVVEPYILTPKERDHLRTR